MLEEYRTPTRKFVEGGDVHHSGELSNDGKKICNQSFLTVEWQQAENAIAAPLCTLSEILLQSVTELGERSSARSTEENESSERLGLSGQRFNTHRYPQLLEKVFSESLAIFCWKKLNNHDLSILHKMKNLDFLNTNVFFSGITALTAFNLNTKAVNGGMKALTAVFVDIKVLTVFC